MPWRGVVVVEHGCAADPALLEFLNCQSWNKGAGADFSLRESEREQPRIIVAMIQPTERRAERAGCVVFRGMKLLSEGASSCSLKRQGRGLSRAKAV